MESKEIIRKFIEIFRKDNDFKKLNDTLLELSHTNPDWKNFATTQEIDFIKRINVLEEEIIDLRNEF